MILWYFTDSLDVENFSKGLMCLSTSGNYTYGEKVEKNSSTIRLYPMFAQEYIFL